MRASSGITVESSVSGLLNASNLEDVDLDEVEEEIRIAEEELKKLKAADIASSDIPTADPNHERVYLIPHQPDFWSKVKPYLVGGTEVGLFILGAGAGALYGGAADSCIKSMRCGKPVAVIIGDRVAFFVYFAGGLDFSLINAYLSSMSLREFYKFLEKQHGLSQKVIKAALILVWALVLQSLPSFFASRSANSTDWELFLSVLGAMPGSLYGTISLANKDLPMMYEVSQRLLSKAHYHFAKHFLNVSEETQTKYHRTIYYEQQYDAFLLKLDASMRYVIAHARTLEIPRDTKHLSFLSQVPLDMVPSCFAKRGHFIAKVLGGGLSLGFSAVFLLNTLRSVSAYMPVPVVPFLSALVLSSSGMYANFKITSQGMGELFDVVMDFLCGHPINSLTFQLHPYFIYAASMVAVAGSALSYALVNQLYESIFPPNGSMVREAFRFEADGLMDFYHFVGILHTFILFYNIFRKKTYSEKERFLHQLHEEVQKLKDSGFDDFVKEVEKENPSLKYQIWGIAPFSGGGAPLGGAYQPIPDVVEGDVENQQQAVGSSSALLATDERLRAETESSASSSKNKGLLSKFCFWRRGKEETKQQPSREPTYSVNY